MSDKFSASTDLDDCTECEGEGELILNSDPCNDPQCEYFETCWMCNGTGKVEDWEPSESQQGLIPIPAGYNEP
jgi:DnaJ-class molecular chaperone